MLRRLLGGRILAASAVLLGVWLLSVAGPAQAAGPRRQTTLMTYNIFQGSELSHLLSTKSFSDFETNAAADYNNLVASNIPARAKALAAEIKANGADLVGLQEAALIRTGSPPNSSPFIQCASASPCTATTVQYDFVQLLVNALRRLHDPYRAVATTNNFDFQATADFGNGNKMDVRLTDRVAILARRGVPVSNVQGQNYAAHDSISLLGSHDVLDGWASVDARVGGRKLRFITTHLDGLNSSQAPSIRNAEAQELLNGPANSAMRRVITCDCNTTPGGGAYQTLAGGGFRDSWLRVHPHQAGLTCCHRNSPSNPEVDVADPNPREGIVERLDYIWAHSPIKVLAVKLLGLNKRDRTKTTPPLWPSDHLGVVGRFSLR